MIRDLVHRDIVSADPEMSVSDAARLMRQHKIGSIFVNRDKEHIGIVTESDLVRKVLTKGLEPSTTVDTVMCSPIIEIDIEKSVIEANHLMHLNKIRHLGISEDGKIIGLISVRDIVSFFSTSTEGPMNELGSVFNPLEVLIHREIKSIHSAATTKEAAERMEAGKIGALFVTEGGEYVGIVSESDMIRKVIGYELDPESIPVGVIMNAPIIDIDIASSVQSATETMAKKGIRHLAVSQEGRIIGILSIRDLVGMISVRDLPRFFSKQP